MNNSSGKLLVQLVDKLTHQQIFFAIWAVIAGGFAWAMYRFYKISQRRNFRPPPPAFPPVANEKGRAVATSRPGTDLDKKAE